MREMFEGDAADTCDGKFPLMSTLGQVEGLACADPGARTPIGVSGNLSLVYKANKEIFKAVNTPSGFTERQTLEKIVLQGDTWGSLLASVHVDSIGQECTQSGYGYLYKNVLPDGIVGLVDDNI